MKQKFTRSLASTIVIGLLSPFLFATSYALPQYTYENCVETMTPFLEWRKLEFSAFLDVHFQSKENTSSLIDGAIEDFLLFKKVVLAELDKFKSGDATSEAQLAGLNGCIVLANQTIEEARDKLKEKVLTVGQIKKTTVLLEKYKTINSKLGDMNILIAKIIAAYETIKNKLPGYLRDCVK